MGMKWLVADRAAGKIKEIVVFDRKVPGKSTARASRRGKGQNTTQENINPY
jgi:hypothetical protein